MFHQSGWWLFESIGKVVAVRIFLVGLMVLDFVAEVKSVEIDAVTVEGWLDPARYFTEIDLEVSRNNFLSKDHPEYSSELAEMVTIKGGLLPYSFYVKYDERAYGRPFVQGETDADFGH